MNTSKMTLTAAAASAACFGLSAVPARASWWDTLLEAACDLGCDLEEFAELQSCGAAFDILYGACVIGAPTRTVEENVACFADASDFLETCTSIANWEAAECEVECA